MQIRLSAQLLYWVLTYVVSTAASCLGKLLSIPKSPIEGIALVLGTMILPIRRHLICEGLCQLRSKQLLGLEICKDSTGVIIPKDTTMLLAGTTDSRYM